MEKKDTSIGWYIGDNFYCFCQLEKNILPKTSYFSVIKLKGIFCRTATASPAGDRSDRWQVWARLFYISEDWIAYAKRVIILLHGRCALPTNHASSIGQLQLEPCFYSWSEQSTGWIPECIRISCFCWAQVEASPEKEAKYDGPKSPKAEPEWVQFLFCRAACPAETAAPGQGSRHQPHDWWALD